MAGAPGGPAVRMMLAYNVRGEDLMQSRTCRRREGVVWSNMLFCQACPSGMNCQFVQTSDGAGQARDRQERRAETY